MATLKELKEALDGTTSNYVCGGFINVNPAWDGIPTRTQLSMCPPIVVRFDGDGATKLTFPIDLHSLEQNALDQLLQGSDQATFGYKGKDVLDESYRKATKLDSSKFSTNFHPHDYGIIDAIRQTLFSTLVGPLATGEYLKETMEGFGVISQLYKLNVYSAPSGKFKSHVDTPRAAEQFGSLVVCLPHPHQGCQLRIAHKNKEATYDWSNEGSKKLKWAAFFGDCEHEVMEVTKGHRVTLTYNLFMCPYPTSAVSSSSLISPDPTMYPVFQIAKALLEDKNFLGKGGLLGFKCTHAYAHTHDLLREALPVALKGRDAIVFAVFEHLGATIQVLPVLDQKTMEPFDASESDDQDEESHASGTPRDTIGTYLHPVAVLDDDMAESIYEALTSSWESIRKHVTWLNQHHVPSELAMACLTYGNEPSIDYAYSYAALIIKVPAFKERIKHLNEVAA